MKKNIIFIISADSEYILETKILIESIRKFYFKEKIFLFTDLETKKKLSREKVRNLEFFTELFNEKLANRFNGSLGTSRNIKSLYRFGRLIFPYFVSDEFSNASFIYLDSDTFIDGKIEEHYLISDRNFAFRQDDPKSKSSENSRKYWYSTLSKFPLVRRRIVKKVFNNQFFNSGVLFINDLKKYKKLVKKCLKSNLKLNDQTLLNYFNHGCIDVIIDTKYNSLIDRTNDDAIIYHYAGNGNLLKVKNPTIVNKDAKLKIENFAKQLF